MPIDDNEYDVMGFCVALPAAYCKADNESHNYIHLWAVQLWQQHHASLQSVPQQTYALAGLTGQGLGLHLACHTWLVVIPGYYL
jgi:hypothetical protein